MLFLAWLPVVILVISIVCNVVLVILKTTKEEICVWVTLGVIGVYLFWAVNYLMVYYIPNWSIYG